MSRIFSSPWIRQQLSNAELSELIYDFQIYKDGGIVSPVFGRDAPYDDTNTLVLIKQEQVWHMHLLSEDAAACYQMRRQYARTSDIHLVYCSGMIDATCYLLIAVLQPNAHELARNNDVMIKVAEIAEHFHQKF
jgi:mRNA interferase YafO